MNTRSSTIKLICNNERISFVNGCSQSSILKKKEERSDRVSKKERLKIRCYKEEEGTREPEEVNPLGDGRMGRREYRWDNCH